MASKRESAAGDAVQGTADTKPNFEASLAELETVVRALEDGQVGLDEALARYEQGIRLLKSCRQALQVAERKILLLTGIDADGNPVTEPFEESATSLEEKKETRSRRRSRADSAGGVGGAGGDGGADGDGDRQKGP